MLRHAPSRIAAGLLAVLMCATLVAATRHAHERFDARAPARTIGAQPEATDAGGPCLACLLAHHPAGPDFKHGAPLAPQVASGRTAGLPVRCFDPRDRRACPSRAPPTCA